MHPPENTANLEALDSVLEMRVEDLKATIVWQGARERCDGSFRL
jgi:hypothetical protein